MVERAEREPTMEEIVVALRETKRSADRMPFAVAGPPRGQRVLRPVAGSSDHTDLRDSEIARLLDENARLNARVVSLLKVIEQEQIRNAETASETAPTEADREAIYREVRAALETELSPFLLVLLRLLERQPTEPAENDDRRRVGFSASPEGAPSDWIIELMRKLESSAPAPNETVRSAEPMPRRANLRERMADVLNAFRLEPYATPSRRRPASPEERV